MIVSRIFQQEPINRTKKIKTWKTKGPKKTYFYGYASCKEYDSRILYTESRPLASTCSLVHNLNVQKKKKLEKISNFKKKKTQIRMQKKKIKIKKIKMININK